MQISQLSAGFVTRSEHETKALHFRIVRFMFEAGIELILNSLQL